MIRRLETAATFVNQQQARIAHGRLLTDGVEACLWDEHVIAVNWLWSYAVRGVKVKVPEHLVEEAVEMLAVDYGDLLLEQEDGTEALTCIHCGSRSIARYQPMRVLAALTLFPFWPIALLLGLPFIKWNAKWRCLACKARM